MLCLKIDNGKGYFLKSDESYEEIDKIGKDDLLYLLDLATDNETAFEMNEIGDDFVGNEAHKIIYSNLREKFLDLLQNRERFLDESESLYKEALLKYKA